MQKIKFDPWISFNLKRPHEILNSNEIHNRLILDNWLDLKDRVFIELIWFKNL